MAGCAPKGMKKGGKVSAGGMKKGGKVSADMVSPRKAEAMGLSKFNKGGMVASKRGLSPVSNSDVAMMSSAMKIGGTKRSNEGRR